MLSPEAADELTRRAFGLYRERHDLLSPPEIVALRESLGVSQADLARLLHLGNNTISRWERGHKVQSASMDTLLRILRDVPEASAYLRTRVA